jgi:putative ABC transport system permease protein
MRWGDAVALALESLRLHRLRTGLTLTGIAIGVTAVLLLTALGDAAKGYIVQQFADIGANLVVVAAGKVETSGLPSPGGVTRDITIDDCEAIPKLAPAVRLVAPLSLGSGVFEYGGRTRAVYVVGTTHEYQTLRNIKISVGEFLPAGDPRQGGNVVVIGRTIQREVFEGENPLGKSVRIAQTRFRVIGVLAPKGQSLGFNYDDLALVPVATGMRLFNQTGLFRVFVQASDASTVPVAMKEVTRVLTARHDGDEDFTLITQDAMLKTFGAIIDALTAALAGIAAISLGVAGIGIMNVMLVSVSERTSEVGLLKALGARRRQILSVFLVEAAALSVTGAALGVVVGVGVILAAGAVFSSFPIRPSAGWIGVVLALALGAGVTFGLMPARRASRLQAAEALRGHR